MHDDVVRDLRADRRPAAQLERGPRLLADAEEAAVVLLSADRVEGDLEHLAGGPAVVVVLRPGLLGADPVRVEVLAVVAVVAIPETALEYVVESRDVALEGMN